MTEHGAAGAGGDGTDGAAAAKRALVRDLALYSTFRVALVVVLTAAIYYLGCLVTDQMPLVVALLFAIIIALPVSMVSARTLRHRVNANVAVLGAARRERRDDFRKRLQGRSE